MKKEIRVFVVSSTLTFLIIACRDDKMEEISEKAEVDDIQVSRIVHQPIMNYPAVAETMEVRGKVIVKVTVGVDGKVVKAETKWSSHKIFEAPAESLAYQYIFEPAIYDGKPRVVEFGLPIIFDPDSTK